MKFFLQLLMVLFAGVAYAQDNDGAQSMEFSAENSIYYEKENRAVLTGNAEIIGDDMYLQANEITVFFDQNGEERELRQMIAVGNVHIKTEDMRGAADQMDYDHASRMAVFSGNVQIKQGQNIANGNHMEFNLNAGIYKMRGPVRGVLGGSF